MEVFSETSPCSLTYTINQQTKNISVEIKPRVTVLLTEFPVRRLSGFGWLDVLLACGHVKLVFRPQRPHKLHTSHQRWRAPFSTRNCGGITLSRNLSNYLLQWRDWGLETIQASTFFLFPTSSIWATFSSWMVGTSFLSQNLSNYLLQWRHWGLETSRAIIFLSRNLAN